MAERVECDHAERCGGCPLIALSYEEQLTRKRARVEEAMARYPSLASAAPEPVAGAAPIVGYRTRAKLIVATDGAIGLFAKGGGHQVVDIPRCRVLASVLATVAAGLRDRVRAAERGAKGASAVLAPFDPAGVGALRAVDLREVHDEVQSDSSQALVTFVLERSRAADLGPFVAAARELMQAFPAVVGVAANFHEGDAPQILGGETVLLAGVARARDHVGGSVHFATFGSFVQAHRGQTGRVHALLADAVGLGADRPAGATTAERPRVLDLYGGSGAIGLSLAAAGARVVLVESFAPAVEQATAAARAGGLDLDAVCSDVAAALEARAAGKERFDAVVINPPRRGMSARARHALGQLDAGVIAYVSCDPETLARDLAHLACLGYATTSLRPVDMIPLTDEVETVALLRRGEVPPPPVVYQDAEVLVVDKGAHEPTTPQGEYAGSLLARVRRIPGAEEAVPVQRLGVGTSGLAVFARRADHVAKWQRALAAPTTRATHVAAARAVTPSKGRIQKTGTRFRRIAIAGGHSVLRVVAEPLDGGRTPPIAQHLASVGHAILGDDRYGHAPTNRYFEEKFGLDRSFLHCARLEVVHPDRPTGAPLVVEAPLAGDLIAVLERMGGEEAVRAAGPPVKRERLRPPPDA
jgi:23S rRNA (uracil1939-C5)-methyltransferase